VDRSPALAAARRRDQRGDRAGRDPPRRRPAGAPPRRRAAGGDGRRRRAGSRCFRPGRPRA
jgi:hypothetical protein